MEKNGNKLKVFFCVHQDGSLPLGLTSFIVAKDHDEADRLLDKELRDCGFKSHREFICDIIEIDTSKPMVYLPYGYKAELNVKIENALKKIKEEE
jgi:hypothetical protein